MTTTAAGIRSMDRPSVNLPPYAFSAAIIGDSQAKYLFHHFDPLAGDSPGFISCRGARIADVPSLIVKLPQGITRLILHVGSNDIVRNGAARVCRDYVWMIRQLQRSRPELRSIHVSLVLPRHTNRRRGNMNRSFVRRFNYEARNFNQEMKRLCYEDLARVYFIDHGFHQLPPWRFLAADGVHTSFEGVALLSEHFKAVLGYGRTNRTSHWLDRFPTAASPSSRSHFNPSGSPPATQTSPGALQAQPAGLVSAAVSATTLRRSPDALRAQCILPESSSTSASAARRNPDDPAPSIPEPGPRTPARVIESEPMSAPAQSPLPSTSRAPSGPCVALSSEEFPSLPPSSSQPKSGIPSAPTTDPTPRHPYNLRSSF